MDKDTAGSFKASLRVVPPLLMIEASGPLAQGAEKYGSFNWRNPDRPISLCGHLEAVLRHLLAYQDGENAAEDSGLSHLAHAVAGLAVMLDADACGALVDDRSEGPAGKRLKEMERT